jgi:hypothetical protein
MKISVFLFAMVFITSCDPPYIEENLYRPSEGKLINEVTNKTLRELKAEKGLHPFGVGSGGMDQIKMLAVSFLYYKEIDIGEARELLLSAGNLYLSKINANEEIQP